MTRSHDIKNTLYNYKKNCCCYFYMNYSIIYKFVPWFNCCSLNRKQWTHNKLRKKSNQNWQHSIHMCSGANVADSIPAWGRYLDWKVRKTVVPCCYYIRHHDCYHHCQLMHVHCWTLSKVCSKVCHISRSSAACIPFDIICPPSGSCELTGARILR